MRKSLLRGVLFGALLFPVTAFPASDAEIAELKSMLNAMKAEYEQRIQALENRLAEAERESARQREEAAESKPMTAAVVHPAPTESTAKPTGGFGALTSGTAFNPQISVILDGNYYHDGIDGEGAALVGEAFQPSGGGHDHEHGGEEDGHDHGLTSNGFNFREAEIAFSATVDPYFDASLYLAIDGDGNVDLEEGWFQTRSLPYGLKSQGRQVPQRFRLHQQAASPPVGLRRPEPALSQPARGPWPAGHRRAGHLVAGSPRLHPARLRGVAGRSGGIRYDPER